MLEELRAAVARANKDLAAHGLVTLTFGNVSGFDRERQAMVIKPSGVAYDTLRPEDMAVVDLAGRVSAGRLRPSSDAPTHLALYRAFPDIGGIAHSHSTHATVFAQAAAGIPCLGTTHADHFHGEVPVTRGLTREEIENEYEANTGQVIIERFKDLDPVRMPAVLVACHGPFTWGTGPGEAVENAVALEEIARSALGTLRLRPDTSPIPRHLLDRHFFRKHGPGAYYGQEG